MFATERISAEFGRDSGVHTAAYAHDRVLTASLPDGIPDKCPQQVRILRGDLLQPCHATFIGRGRYIVCPQPRFSVKTG